MAEKTKASRQTKERGPVLRTFALAPICGISRWRELDDGIGVCRITVIGNPPGPASSPPKITFYVKDGGYPEAGRPLRADEAKRCAAALHVGDVVELIGDVGPERDRARRQEVVVTEPVKLKERAPVEEDDPGQEQGIDPAGGADVGAGDPLPAAVAA
ncbi:MAG TPA: hypothetical protein VHA80_03305 [Solirubrobacterales bacterium]|nr:hypothetical protein [Solirubrobacterales bacterium]